MDLGLCLGKILYLSLFIWFMSFSLYTSKNWSSWGDSRLKHVLSVLSIIYIFIRIFSTRCSFPLRMFLPEKATQTFVPSRPTNRFTVTGFPMTGYVGIGGPHPCLSPDSGRIYFLCLWLMVMFFAVSYGTWFWFPFLRDVFQQGMLLWMMASRCGLVGNPPARRNP